jgi:hypothetical protein
MRHTLRLSLCALALAAGATAHAAGVGINFRRQTSGEQNMAASESAGVVPQTNWNNTDAAGSTGTSGANIAGPTVNTIVDDTGAAVPGMSVAWTSNGTWSTTNVGAGDLNLMAGYLDDTGTAGETIITVTGVPYANYDVYAYLGSDGNNRSGRTRLNNFFPNDRWIRTNTAPFTTFVEGTATAQPASNTGLANYTHYRTLNTSSFELRVQRGSNNVGLHGLQIVQTDGSVPANWTTGAAPAAPAALSPALASIGVNFVGGRADVNQPDGFAQDDGIVTTSAGVVSQSNWNNLTGFTGTAAAGSLVNASGAPVPGTTVAWNSNNAWSINTAVPGDGNAALMKGYLDTNDLTTTTVNVGAIPATWVKYDVYVYFDSDNAAGRAGNYTISSANDGSKTATAIDLANWDVATAGGAFTRSNENAEALTTAPGYTTGNYLVFTGRTDSSFLLSAAGSAAGLSTQLRAPISAIQLVATQLVPEPTSLSMLGLGALLVGARARRRAAR